jgi:leader peptidase (prepilin peptidase)/N-methyltransferase
MVVVAAVLGLVVGSFLNVVVHRVPRGESVVRPASHCPRCLAKIRPQHNIPVLGWLLLRGRCADCGLPISPRYPLVEAGTAMLFAGLAWRLADLELVSALPA